MLLHCKPIRRLFPPNPADEFGFMVCLYRMEKVTPPVAFTARGGVLPSCPASSVTLEGDWVSTGKAEERVFEVKTYNETLPDSPQAAMAFLMNLPFCNLKAASQIVHCAGETPMSNLDIHGKEIMNEAHVHNSDSIWKHYCIRRTKKSLFDYLCRYVSSDEILCAVDTAMAASTLDQIKKFPFKFCCEGLLPYAVARTIGKENGVSLTCPDGVKAAIMDILLQNEGASMGQAFRGQVTGNTCLPLKKLKDKVAIQLGMLPSSPALDDALHGMVKTHQCYVSEDGFIYRFTSAVAEHGIARELSRLSSFEPVQKEYRDDIYDLENRGKMRLAPEQRRGVKTALANAVTLLIGGPGTGKTTIERVIIGCFHKHHSSPVVLVAPTGIAARRMTESCGEQASTVHKALNVSADSEILNSDVTLDAGLVIIDEASMLDAQTCWALFKAIPTGAQVVIVGDTNQLPSVGAGNVLYELIASKLIPTVALETVYRQKAGSTIAINCARIKRGTVDLDFTDSFVFLETASQDDAANAVVQAYKRALDSGVPASDICVLSPYRRNTPTGINNLNPRLRSVSPLSPVSLKYGKTEFYLGDRIMSKKNRGDVANGDIGYITDITGNKFTVDYGDERKETLKKGALRDFDLAFGISIHKSQGAEFPICIIVVTREHTAMLKRNLLYTAVSRAKQKVVLVGNKDALEKAILTEDATKRVSRLSKVFSMELSKKGAEV